MNCILCDSETSSLVERGIRNDPEGEIRRCDYCGFTYLDPQPTEAQLGEYYQAKYRQDSRMAYKRFDRGMVEAERRAAQMAYSVVRPIHSVLDIGAGAGSFVYTMDISGVQVVGIEPDVKSRSFLYECYLINMLPKLEMLREEEKFDTIVMFHTLEHLPDPVGFLRLVKQHLAPDGKLIVEVPNIKDHMLILKSYAKTYFFQRPHLWYFSRKTLRNLFEKAGYEVEISNFQRYNVTSQLRWWLKGHNNGDGNEDDLKKSWVSRLHSGLLEGVGKADTLWAVAGG
jgi:2-polyprenyl-3-methyl-5-hydroxy-6-metoxy-1,4-benzoquinol methylase